MTKQKSLSIFTGLTLLASAHAFSARAQTSSQPQPVRDVDAAVDDVATAIKALDQDLTVGQAISALKITRQDFTKAVATDPKGEYYDLVVTAGAQLQKIETQGVKTSSSVEIDSFFKSTDALMKWRASSAHFAEVMTFLNARDDQKPLVMTPASVLITKITAAGPEVLQESDPVNAPRNMAWIMATNAAALAGQQSISFSQVRRARDSALGPATQLITEQNVLARDLKRALVNGVGTVPNLPLELIRSERAQQAESDKGTAAAKAELSKSAHRPSVMIDWSAGITI